jgi:hypothetical protein
VTTAAADELAIRDLAILGLALLVWPPQVLCPLMLARLDAQRPSVIMTAPTVALVDSSMRMRPPVSLFRL